MLLNCHWRIFPLTTKFHSLDSNLLTKSATTKFQGNFAKLSHSNNYAGKLFLRIINKIFRGLSVLNVEEINFHKTFSIKAIKFRGFIKTPKFIMNNSETLRVFPSVRNFSFSRLSLAFVEVNSSRRFVLWILLMERRSRSSIFSFDSKVKAELDCPQNQLFKLSTLINSTPFQNCTARLQLKQWESSRV